MCVCLPTSDIRTDEKKNKSAVRICFIEPLFCSDFALIRFWLAVSSFLTRPWKIPGEPLGREMASVAMQASQGGGGSGNQSRRDGKRIPPSSPHTLHYRFETLSFASNKPKYSGVARCMNSIPSWVLGSSRGGSIE